MTTEQRLIDANALRRHMEKAFELCGLNFITKNDVLYCIDNSDTVDAVPVVRCKDCDFCHYNSSNDTYKCVSMNGMYRTVNENEFCSYGERREGE